MGAMISRYHDDDICYQENSIRLDIHRASFASLPGELRNELYKTTLECPGPIALSYNALNKRFIPSSTTLKGRTPIQALELLSNIDHNIRTEARCYFFATNVFEITTKQTLSTDADYIETYIAFLRSIGDIGRRSLRHLRLVVTGDSKQHHPMPSKARKLWDLISKCQNLITLDIYAEIDYFYMDQMIQLRRWLCLEGPPISTSWSYVSSSLKMLPNLRRAVLRPVFSSRWRYCVVCEDDRDFFPGFVFHHDDYRMRYQAKRPQGAVPLLCDQLKGYVRRDLRGSGVSIRVLALETWDLMYSELMYMRLKSNEDGSPAYEMEFVKGPGKTRRYRRVGFRRRVV